MITELPKKVENPDFSAVEEVAEEFLAYMMMLKRADEEKLDDLSSILAGEVLTALYGPDITKIIAENIADKLKEFLGDTI